MAITSGYSQRIDSLKQRLSTARDADLCLIFHQLSYEMLDSDFKEALFYAKKSVQCAEARHDSLQLVKGIRLQAIAYRRIGAIDSSNLVISNIVQLARQKHYYAELQDLLHGLALGMLYKAQFDESLKYNFEALEIRKIYGKPYDIASTLSNIGYVYYKLADYSTALEYFKEGLEYGMQDPRDGKVTEKILVNTALSHAYLGNYKQVDSFIEKALRSCKTNCAAEDLQNIAFCRGIVSLNRHDTATAKLHFFESYTRAVADNHERIQLDNIIYLSRIFLSSEETSEAARYLSMAEKLILKGVPYNMELMKIYTEFAALYERKGDYKKVVDFQRRHMALKDSIYDDEVTTSLMRIEAAHVEKEKNAKIEMQNKLLEKDAKIMARQKVATILAFTSLCFLTGCVVLLVRNNREKKLRNQDLEQRVKSRTKELEAMVNQSHRWLNEKKQWVDKIVSSVKHSTNTIAGLCSLAMKDPELSDEYLKLIDQEARYLLTHVAGYASKSEESVKDFRGTA